MPTMMEIQDNIREWLSMADDENMEAYAPEDRDAVSRAVLAQLDELGQQEAAKTDSYGMFMLSIENEIDFLKQEQDRIATKRKQMEKKYESVKDRLIFVMELNEIKKLSGHVHTIAIGTSTAVVVETEPDKLPEPYRRVIPETIQPDKKAIGDALKSGVDVPGCRLENHKNLRVR